MTASDMNIASALDIFNYGLVLIYGLVLDVAIAGGCETARQKRVILYLCPAFLLMESLGWLTLGEAGVKQIYPIIVHLPLVLILVGIVYICETLSDIIQVGYFKLTHGKRIFKMAPLHHHFEMCGWKETKVVAVFTAVSVIGCVIAYLAVYQRFGF